MSHIDITSPIRHSHLNPISHHKIYIRRSMFQQDNPYDVVHDEKN